MGFTALLWAAKQIALTAGEQSDEEDERKQIYLAQVRKMYERMADIGDDKTDVFALGRLALINMAFDAEFGADDEDRSGPPREVLRNVSRAWQRFQRQLSPTDVRHHAEIVLSFWGSLLLSSYPQQIVAADLSKDTVDPKLKEKLLDAKAKAAEFQRAVQILFPTAQPARLADFPKLSGIGTRIGCLCVLARMTAGEENTTEFFLTKVNKWQQSTKGFRSLASCRSDLLPRRRLVPARQRVAAQRAKSAFELAKAAAERVDPPSVEVKAALEKTEAAYNTATADLEQAQKSVEQAVQKLKEKEKEFAQAASFCHVGGDKELTPPAPLSP